MKSCSTILEAIGNTPLVRLAKLYEPKTHADVYGKCDFLLPSGSLKDRMALRIIEEAERAGTIKPGGTFVEATAGNTGLAVALVAGIKGYKTIFVMPDKFSVEKINMLKAFGSRVVITPTAVPEDHPESWREVAKRIVSETPNAVLVDQFFNLHNVEAHYRTTGPEIWEQTGGKIDAFVAGAGSGGTITGVGRYLKEQAKAAGRQVRIVLVDPVGSCYYDAFYKRQKKQKKGWKMEGIGNDFVPGCLDLSVVDEVRQISDRYAFGTARLLARDEGLLVGDTSGAGVFIALELARELGPGKTVVTMLADSGNRYISKTYNDDWMHQHGFATHGLEFWHGMVRDLLRFKGDHVEFADATDSISAVAARMSALGISQMPIKGDAQRPHMMIHESDLLHFLLRNNNPDASVLDAAASLQGTVNVEDEISVLEPLLDRNDVAVVTNDQQEIVGIVTRIDLVKYLASTAH